jgi:hypothetical protein
MLPPPQKITSEFLPAHNLVYILQHKNEVCLSREGYCVRAEL